MAKKKSKTDGKKKADSKSKGKGGKSRTGKTVAVAVGTAAAAVAVGAAVKRAVGSGKTVVGSGKTVYEVKTHDEGWQVIKDGASRASSVHRTKKEAVSEARDLAASQAPSELHIYKQDGGLSDSHSYEPEEQ